MSVVLSDRVSGHCCRPQRTRYRRGQGDLRSARNHAHFNECARHVATGRFLADVFACFKRHGVSVDLVSTSETNVTASFDQKAAVVAEETLGTLGRFTRALRATLLRDCASVSLVGRHIRAILHQLGPALQVFESQKIHMLCQAASDLNLTFVVDGAQADRLVGKLHALLFNDEKAAPHLSPTWHETFEAQERSRITLQSWWHAKADELCALTDPVLPTYVYHGETIDDAARDLTSLEPVDRVFYAIKANDNPMCFVASPPMGLDLSASPSARLNTYSNIALIWLLTVCCLRRILHLRQNIKRLSHVV